jgi:hypothetical protein
MSALNTRAQKVVIVLLVTLLYGALAFGFYWSLTRHALGANDFYSRWVGARALILRGENPYSAAVTREIQIGMYGRLARSDEDQVAFAYPLYAAFVAAPLVTLPYASAQALWMASLVFAVVGGVLVLARLNRIALSPALFAALVLGGLIFYPSLRGIFLGQYALVSFFCLALALGALQTRRDWAAGLLLALMTVKPQSAVFLVPTLVVWAVWQRRWKIVGGTVGGWVVLVILALLWVPTWLSDFGRALQDYARYEPVGPPMQTLSEWTVPNALSMPVTIGAILALVGWMVWWVARSLKDSWEAFQPIVSFVAFVTTLTAGRVGTPDQTLLLIPWLYWLGEWLARGQRMRALVAALVILLLPWTVFLLTLRGNTEHVGVTLVLPFLTLAVAFWHVCAPPRSRMRAERG